MAGEKLTMSLPATLRFACVLMVVSLTVPYVSGEEIVPVLGTIEFTDRFWECYGCDGNPWHTRPACSDSTPPALGLTFGCINGLEECHGDILGSFTELGTEIDGVRLFNNTLPTDSFYTFGIWYDNKYGCDCCSSCGSWPQCEVEWSIGSQSGTTADDGVPYEFLASEIGDSLDFQFRFCGHAVYWGGACGIMGADTRQWRLHLPAPLRARWFDPVDPPPHAFPGTGITVDLDSSPGGIVTATFVEGEPPCPPPDGIVKLPGYWEVRTNMTSGSFTAKLTISYDPTDIPSGVSEQYLKVWRCLSDSGTWELLDTIIDTTNHTATVVPLTDFGVFILGVCTDENGNGLPDCDETLSPPLSPGQPRIE
ncbi:MAG: hypothetical protein ACYS6Z_17105 [Planctomycetota bacterium]|jgi:hypothetical protein